MKNTKQKITPNTNEAQQLPGLNDWYFDILTKCQLPVELPSTILCVINDFCKSIVGYHYDKSEPIATIAELSLNNASFTFELWLYLLKYNTRNQNDNNIIGCARGNTDNGWLHRPRIKKRDGSFTRSDKDTADHINRYYCNIGYEGRAVTAVPVATMHDQQQNSV
eukprot:140247_1